MKHFTYCEKCGKAVPIFENGLCQRCFRETLHAARTATEKTVRPNRINIGLKTCVVCGVRAASLRGMCSICYKRAQYAAKQKAAKAAAEAGETLK